MSKIGIVTHYYNSTNYGGSLQAYALCKVLNNMGHDARQLRIDHTASCRDLTDTGLLALAKKIAGKPAKKLIKTAMLYANPKAKKAHLAAQRHRKTLLKAFSNFNENTTPHSDQVYTEKTIRHAVDQYDAFITGSDQVWNPNWYFPPFFLSFVPADKIKLSYAASISHPTLSDNVKRVFAKHLQDFRGVSVREESAVALLEDVAPCPVACVLDPTMLLTGEDWAQVASDRQYTEDYVFCYFLNDDLQCRQAAEQYAKSHNLLLVNIANAAGHIHQNDNGFGDRQIENPSVEDFLSLIQHASYVFTDSFHASVFSVIFQRQFMAFARSGYKHMSSRLYHLTNLFEIEEHFCDEPETFDLQTLDQIPPIDYKKDASRFREAKQFSLEFLANNLK